MTVVQQIVIRFEEPRDRQGMLMAREDWVQGVSEAAIGGVRAWAAGARAVFEPKLEIEQVESCSTWWPEGTPGRVTS